MKLVLLFISTFILVHAGCKENTNQATNPPLHSEHAIQPSLKDGLESAYFASGCFWCVEAIYESVKGVQEVISGYSGGHTQNPTYKSSNTGRTGHAETVHVIYDPKIISFSELVTVYFGSQNPTQSNGQGPDHGSQYRSIIFYQNNEEKSIIEQQKTALATALNEQIAAAVNPFQQFWKAEEYHQDYEKRHPNQPYIQRISVPRLKRFQAQFPELLKDQKEAH